MKIKTINLKSKLTNTVLRNNMFKFFRRYNDNSPFITLSTKLTSDSSNSPVFVLNNKITLDVKSKSEITTYINLLSDKFNEHNKEIKKHHLNKISISYYLCTKEEHLNYIKTSWIDLIDK